MHSEGPAASPNKQVSPYSIIVLESHDIMSPLIGGGAAVPFAGLHQSEGNSLVTFLSVTGGALLSNWSRAPSQLDREKKDMTVAFLYLLVPETVHLYILE